MFEAPKFFYRYYRSKITLNIDLSFQLKPTKSKTKRRRSNGRSGSGGDPEDDGDGSEGDDDGSDNDELHDEDDTKKLRDEEFHPIDGMDVQADTPWADIGIAQALKTLGVVVDFIRSRSSTLQDTMHQLSADVRTLGAQIAAAQVISFITDYLHTTDCYLPYLFWL